MDTELKCDEDCIMCSGEYCEQHFDQPCDCDVVDRHTTIEEKELEKVIVPYHNQNGGIVNLWR